MDSKTHGIHAIDTAAAVALILTADGLGPSTSATTLPPPATATVTQQSASTRFRVLEHLREDIDPDRASFPLVWYCFMTGFADVVTFSVCFIWCAFQTGNTIHLGLATAQLLGRPGYYSRFQIADQQALVSLSAFLGGASIGRVTTENAAYLGPRRRAWLVGATLMMAVFSLAASLLAQASRDGDIARSPISSFNSGTPAWTDASGFAALGFMSASMGLQAIVGTRLGSHFATSVVFTTALVEIISDPSLHKLNRRMLARDSRLLAILSLVVGGILARALVDTIGAASTLAVGTGIRFVIAVLWLFAPATTPKE